MFDVHTPDDIDDDLDPLTKNDLARACCFSSSVIIVFPFS